MPRNAELRSFAEESLKLGIAGAWVVSAGSLVHGLIERVLKTASIPAGTETQLKLCLLKITESGASKKSVVAKEPLIQRKEGSTANSRYVVCAETRA